MLHCDICKRDTGDDSLQQIKVHMHQQPWQQILHRLQNQIFAPTQLCAQAGEGVGQLETWMTVAVLLSNQ